MAQRSTRRTQGSNSVSGFNFGKNGTLTPIAGTIVGSLSSDSRNVDIAITANEKYVYTIDSQSGNIGTFEVNSDDTLNSLGQAGDLPKSVVFNGIAAL
jgi:6-phosphogluconolactonase